MKTVGQIIASARQKRGLSVDQLSSLTKIDSRYISALEQDDYQKLPSETFAKGFIRNLSLRLDLDPSELIAIFRRDYRLPEPSSMAKRHTRFAFPDYTKQTFPFLLGGIVFIVYLIFQFRAIVTPPKLIVLRPEDGAVMVSPLEIEGETDADATIIVNGDTKVRPDSTGHFFVRLNLSLGETILELKTTNRFSRSTTKSISVTIISK